MKIDPYIRTKGEHAGEPAASLESTLVHIGLIKIDGTQVYPTSQAQAEAPPAEDASASEADDAIDTATEPTRHLRISYAVFCLKQKNYTQHNRTTQNRKTIISTLRRRNIITTNI